MATQPTYPAPFAQPAQATTEPGPGLLERWRARHAEGKQARLVSARNRRALARMLRGIAKDAIDPNPLRRPLDVLSHYRAAAVRTDLLEIAAMLERAHNPDPLCVAALRHLVRDGISPLYNPAVHVSKLHTTLDYIRSGLSGAGGERAFSAVVRPE
jgi:hypothetical protein